MEAEEDLEGDEEVDVDNEEDEEGDVELDPEAE